MAQNSRVASVLGLFSDIGWYGVVPVVQKIIGLALLPIYTRYLTPTDYGIVALVALVVGAASFLADWGVTYSILRDYLDYKGDEANEFLFTVLILQMLASVIAFGSVFLLGKWLIPLVVPEWQVPYSFYLHLSLMAAILNGVGAVTKTFLVIERRPQAYSILQLIVYGVSVAVQLYMLIVLRFGVLAMFYPSLITALFSMVGGLVILWPHLRPRFRFDVVRAVFEYGRQTMPIGVVGYILRRADRWVIQSVLPISQLGMYSFGAKFQDIMAIYGNSVKQAWRPVYLRQLKENAGREELIKYGNAMVEISLLVTLGLMLFSKEIIQILAAPEYHSTYVVASILAGQVFFQKIVSFVGHNSLVYEKKLYFGMITLVVTSGLNVGLSVVLVPRIGIEGAALALLLSFVVNAAMANFWASRYTRVGCVVDWPRWLSLIALAGLLSLLVFAFRGWSLGAFFALKTVLLLVFAGMVALLERGRISKLVKQAVPALYAATGE